MNDLAAGEANIRSSMHQAPLLFSRVRFSLSSAACRRD